MKRTLLPPNKSPRQPGRSRTAGRLPPRRPGPGDARGRRRAVADGNPCRTGAARQSSHAVSRPPRATPTALARQATPTPTPAGIDASTAQPTIETTSTEAYRSAMAEATRAGGAEMGQGTRAGGGSPDADKNATTEALATEGTWMPSFGVQGLDVSKYQAGINWQTAVEHGRPLRLHQGHRGQLLHQHHVQRPVPGIQGRWHDPRRLPFRQPRGLLRAPTRPGSSSGTAAAGAPTGTPCLPSSTLRGTPTPDRPSAATTRATPATT